MNKEDDLGSGFIHACIDRNTLLSANAFKFVTYQVFTFFPDVAEKVMALKGILIVALISLVITGAVLLFVQLGELGMFLVKLAISLAIIISITLWSLEKIYGFKKAKMILGTVALLGISCGVILLITEAFVRYSFSDVTTTGENSSYFAKRWREMNPPIANQWGFREREFSVQKERSTYRIAIVGDSFTYGQGISESERFSNIIEHSLRQLGNKYEVLNFGRSGAETIDHVAILDKFVFSVAPDYVLLQWFVNDGEGHDKSKRPRPYRLVPSQFLGRYLHTHSALYYIIKSHWGKLQVALGLTPSYRDYMEERFGDSTSKDSRAAIDWLKEFFRRLQIQDIPVGVVIFPQMVEVEGAVENYPLGFLIDRVIEACRQQRVPWLDLRPIFAPVTPASKLRVNRFDGHPGPLANELAAEAILDRFKNEWIFDWHFQ